MNWHTILLESPSKRLNDGTIKPRRVIRGICEINNKYYYLDYILFTEFKWWSAIETNPNFDLDALKTLPVEKYYNSETNTMVNYENLPNNIKSLC